MSTVIGIFENQYLNNKTLTVVNLALNQEGLHILMIRLKYATLHGKKIFVDTTV